MAKPIKRGDGWRQQVRVAGHPTESKTFVYKADAIAWGAQRTAELKSLSTGAVITTHTLSEACDRFYEEIGQYQKSARTQRIRLEFIKREFGNIKLLDITTPRLAAWRDKRLKEVVGATIVKDLSLLSGIFKIARIEWKWCAENPVKDVRKPQQSRHRDRVITQVEINKIIERARYKLFNAPATKSQQVAVVFLIALATGMRSSEIVGLTWGNVDFEGRRFILPDTKNGTRRDVPMIGDSEKLVRAMVEVSGTDYVFSLNAATLSALFRKIQKMAGLSGFTFHDSRHTAATQIAPKIDVLSLCKIFGWRNPKQAMVYYNPTAKDLLKMLGN